MATPPARIAVSTVELALIERLAGLRVLVVGDAMLDEYVEGDADRICPEAPVPVVRVTGTTVRPGGAANVALNVAALGAVADLATVVGVDAAGEQLVALCADAGIGTDLVVRAADRSTTRKLRVIARKHQMLRLDWEQTDSLAPRDAGALLDRLARAPRPDTLILSDYAKGCSHARGPPARHRPGPGLGRSGPRRSQGSRPRSLPRRDRAHPEPKRVRRRGSAFPRTPSSLAGSPSWAAPSSTASRSTISW